MEMEEDEKDEETYVVVDMGEVTPLEGWLAPRWVRCRHLRVPKTHKIRLREKENKSHTNLSQIE